MQKSIMIMSTHVKVGAEWEKKLLSSSQCRYDVIGGQK